LPDALAVPNEKQDPSYNYSKYRIYIRVGDDKTVPFEFSNGRARRIHLVFLTQSR
jgi:hypothetical protein